MYSRKFRLQDIEMCVHQIIYYRKNSHICTVHICLLQKKLNNIRSYRINLFAWNKKEI